MRTAVWDYLSVLYVRRARTISWPLLCVPFSEWCHAVANACLAGANKKVSALIANTF